MCSISDCHNFRNDIIPFVISPGPFLPTDVSASQYTTEGGARTKTTAAMAASRSTLSPKRSTPSSVFFPSDARTRSAGWAMIVEATEPEIACSWYNIL